ARSLRSQQSTTLGLIVSDIRNPFFTSISRAVEDTAYEQGYSLMLCNTDENPEKETIYLNLMQDAGIAGVIISPTRQNDALFASSNYPIPIVVIDRPIVNGDVDAVLLDNIAAAYRLATHLTGQGYQSIGILSSEMSTGQERQEGYEKALREHGLAPRTEHMKIIPPKMEAGYEATLKILDTIEPPDALFTVNSVLAAGALQAIRERSLTIPADIALVTFDETTWASLVQPAITLIAQPTYEIGKTATELLLQRIADPTRPTRHVILTGQLLVRGSSAARQKT
ncbi:MAG TPA: substrate-binding domain-containing protein, partial [Ktedonobacteraceae bacterium]|nr:substrate-binding domain-containing protein [Ktedonobacteraceae bacterium]